jgi:hypothetical protein
MNLIPLPIIILQSILNYDYMIYIIKISKFLTKSKSYYIYFAILFYCDYLLFPKVMFIFYISRIINTKIKNIVKQNRPYNDYPDKIKFFKKRKDSYSFPSQSVQCMYIIYYSYKKLCNVYWIDVYFYTIIILLIITRLYRGLHYLHDTIFSLLISKLLCKCIDYI